MKPYDPTIQVATELNLPLLLVNAVNKLIEEGNTVPFIARYRKEVTGNLDEVQIRNIVEKTTFLKELHDRKETILKTIESQGKLTEELRKKIEECEEKNTLEDLYLPFKPKRRTKATIAREKGLEPLALCIYEQPLEGDPQEEARKFVNVEKGVETVFEALEGARHIVAEWISENADVRALVRDAFLNDGIVRSTVRSEFKEKETKYSQYYKFSEPIKKIPSHRFLAIRRGAQELVLDMDLEVESQPIIERLLQIVRLAQTSPYAKELETAVKDSYRRLIIPSVETDIRIDLKMRSDRGAIEIFASNLENLLNSPPLGCEKVIGIDPGFRTGCKCAAVSSTGTFLDNTTFYILKGNSSQSHEKEKLLKFVKKHQPIAIAIGNGTASRETEQFVKEALNGAEMSSIIVVQVSESGASVYSASEVAREEFPDLDLTIRGAISIARRLQDPLAELVKVEPKALGVGQYQHDVYQPFLEQKLHDVVEGCVNKVGVYLNTASVSLLSYVAGVGSSLAKKIVKFRDQYGAFSTRKELLKVPGLGEKSFQQAAGFLRIRGAQNPLDASAVHPERYELVTKIAHEMGCSLAELIGNHQLINQIQIKKYINESVGELTLKDIVEELKKPGRDPRKTFEMPKFRDDVTKIEELKKGMILEGIVTNVTAFGAFVDIGVHQDGLVHISQISDRFIKDPSEVVKAGDKIKVEVIDINVEMKRISLSAVKSKVTHKKFSSNPFSRL